jgi:disulfide bond formation protein DsbB
MEAVTPEVSDKNIFCTGNRIVMVYNVSVKELAAQNKLRRSSFVIEKGETMRLFIYLIVIINSALGLYILFRENNPFKGKTYKDISEKNRKNT